MDPLFSIVDPRGKNLNSEMRSRAFAATVRVQQEVDEGLRVVWDDERRKFAVLDTAAPGGPEASYVLLVQEPDGAFRDFDQRTIDKLRELRFGHDEMKETMTRLEQERARETVKRRTGYGDQLEDAFKFVGQSITSTVESRNRTREAIRKVAE